MTYRVFVVHPDHPERNGYVTQTAFAALWSKKGYEIAQPPTTEPLEDPGTATVDELNAELDRRAQEDAPATDDPPDDEKARLTARLEAAGVTVDGRWGPKRLRAEVATLEADPS